MVRIDEDVNDIPHNNDINDINDIVINNNVNNIVVNNNNINNVNNDTNDNNNINDVNNINNNNIIGDAFYNNINRYTTNLAGLFDEDNFVKNARNDNIIRNDLKHNTDKQNEADSAPEEQKNESDSFVSLAEFFKNDKYADIRYNDGTQNNDISSISFRESFDGGTEQMGVFTANSNNNVQINNNNDISGMPIGNTSESENAPSIVLETFSGVQNNIIQNNSNITQNNDTIDSILDENSFDSVEDIAELFGANNNTQNNNYIIENNINNAQNNGNVIDNNIVENNDISNVAQDNSEQEIDNNNQNILSNLCQKAKKILTSCCCCKKDGDRSDDKEPLL